MDAAESRLLETWQSDSTWTDEMPQVQVTRPKGAFCQLDCNSVVGMHPAAVFEAMCDTGNKRIFRNAQGVSNRRVIEDTAERKVVELEMSQSWSFLFLSGEFSVNLRLTQDKPNYKLYFELSKPGFMKKFHGVWSVEPLPMPPSQGRSGPAPTSAPVPTARPQTSHGGRMSLGAMGRLRSMAAASFASSVHPQLPEHSSFEATDLLDLALQVADVDESKDAASSAAVDDLNIRGLMVSGSGGPAPSLPWYGKGTRVASKVMLHQQVQPSLNPPPMFAHYLRGIAAKSILEAMGDIQVEAARLRYGIPEDSDVIAELRKRGYNPLLHVAQEEEKEKPKQQPEVGHRLGKKKSGLRDWSVADGKRAQVGRRSKRLSEKEKWTFSKNLEAHLKQQCPSVRISGQ